MSLWTFCKKEMMKINNEATQAYINYSHCNTSSGLTTSTIGTYSYTISPDIHITSEVIAADNLGVSYISCDDMPFFKIIDDWKSEQKSEELILPSSDELMEFLSADKKPLLNRVFKMGQPLNRPIYPKRQKSPGKVRFHALYKV